MKSKLIAVLTMILGCSAHSHAETFSGNARIIDGDTLAFGEEVVRLLDIDAPETRQKCKRGSKSYQAGVESLNWLRELTRGGVECRSDKTDSYGRWLAVCRLPDGTDLSARMVSSGWAFTYRDEPTYKAEQKNAAANGFGVHAGDCEKPWDFRERMWTEGVKAAPDPNCPIKGNISGNGRIYHAPWSQWYARTKINTSNCEREGGVRFCEQWFCNEGQARSAGWRAPYR